MSIFSSMQDRIVAFRDAREWRQFHTPKDLAIGLNLEASEVLEHFLWMDATETKKYVQANKEAIGHELADTLYYVLLMANDLEINLEEAFDRKMLANEKKYSVEKAKGNHKKYTELQ